MHQRLVFVAALASAGFLACPGAAHADEPVPIGKPPTLSHFVQAEYPKDKHDAGITAHVVLSIEIGDDGKVGNVEVVEGAGEDFDRAAVAAARQFVFTPAESNGQAIPVDHPGLAYRLFDQDQTHVLGLLASYDLGRGFEVGGRFRYATGMPRTPVVGHYLNSLSGYYET